MPLASASSRSKFACFSSRDTGSGRVAARVPTRGENRKNPDYYNVYKNNGNGYGLIATFAGRKAITGLNGSVDNMSFLVPKSKPFGFVGAVDFEEARRWTSGTLFRLLVDGNQRTLSEHVSSDVSLIMTTRKSRNTLFRMTFGANGRKRFDTVAVTLDGRMYDEENDEYYESDCDVAYDVYISFWQFENFRIMTEAELKG